MDQNSFAQGLISYAKSGRSATLNRKGEGGIPDHWTYSSEESEWSGATCCVAHGLFDRVFKRRAIIPRDWEDFKQQYLSPIADLLTRMHQECQNQNVHSWNPGTAGRNDFPVRHDFWTRKTQEENFRFLLGLLAQQGILGLCPSRPYSDDPNAARVRVNGEWIDVPGSYRVLDLAVREMGETDMKYSDDFPRCPTLYGGRTPVMFAVADSNVLDKDAEGQEIYRLVEAQTSPTPKLQHILYVLADKDAAGTYTPRYVGRMHAYMLEVYDGCPAGAVLYENTYLVEQPDMSVDERKSLRCDQSNWNGHHQGMIDRHSALKAYLESLK